MDRHTIQPPPIMPQSNRFLRFSHIGGRYQSLFLALWIALAYILIQNTLAPAALLANEGESLIVINEIHYNPSVKTQAGEFIELYNHGETSLNLSGWQIDGAVSFTIPYAVLEPKQYLIIAQDVETAKQLWNVPTIGPFTGNLSTRTETITLRDLNATIVDEVTYQLGFPWPTVGEWPGNSIGLIHPDMDNDLGGSWRSNAPTPAARNIQFSTDAPPHIEQVSHSPQQPTSNSYVNITARVSDPDGIANVDLSYQIVEPGQYISTANAEYHTGWINVPMQSTGDNDVRGMLYSAVLPSDVQKHRRLIRYRIRVRDRLGNEISAPYIDDPQPNFAYFVYDNLPPWTGAIRPGVDQPIVHDFNAMNPLPVYHLIADYADVRAALFESQYVDSDFPWTGTLVYDGVVYDHIGFRARGGGWRYSLGKNMIKFDFKRGHYFQAHDDFGTPYKYKWDKLNLSAIIQHPHMRRRGEQGLSETIGYKLFNLAGVAAPNTNYIHFRIIDDAVEVPSNQYEGDFMGLYLAVEQMDGIFLKEHDLPDGNLYKMEKPTGYLNNQGENAVRNRSDLDAFQAGYQGTTTGPSEQWWSENLDLDNYYSYRAIIEAIRHYDINGGKNYFYYLNPTTNLWQVHPWDIDQTWSDTSSGTGNEPFLNEHILDKPTISLDYRNRLREIRDLLFNGEQLRAMLNEYTQIVDTPTNLPSMVDADRAMWDYHPIMESSFISVEKTLWGIYYQYSPTGDFRGMSDLLDAYADERMKWIDAVLLDDPKVPDQPTISYSGPNNYPTDKLRFTSSQISGVPEASDFAAMEWRIAEINYFGSLTYDPNQPRRYEIESSWESGELRTFNDSVAIPKGICHPGRTCRARVRIKNNRGRWSNWSEKIEFVTGQPQQPITRILKATEIMYAPAHLGSTSGDELEFLELKNVGNEWLDLATMYFSAGITYTFPSGAGVDVGESIILASNATRFQERYGFPPLGEYKGHLKNGGEKIVLLDIADRLVFSVEYDNKSPWPLLPDGGGHSLVLDDHADSSTDLQDVNKWRKSTLVDGSPGADDPAEVLINEILANPGIGQVQSIELLNSTRRNVKLGHWYLSDDPNEPRKFRFPAGTEVPAGGFRLLRVSEFASISDGTGFTLDPLGGAVYLFSATRSGRLTGYQQRFVYGASEKGYSFGRHVTSIGEVRYPLLNPATMGGPNVEPINGPVVVTRLRYHGAIADEFIELTNVSAGAVNLYDPGTPEDRWKLKGILFEFPAGLMLQAGESIYLVPTLPATFCTSELLQAQRQAVQSGTAQYAPRVIGPYVTDLPDAAGEFTILRPGTKPESGQRPYFPVDSVRYKKSAPWPDLMENQEAMLERVTPSAYGDDPLSWGSSHGIRAATLSQTSPATSPKNNTESIFSLCSFDAIINKNSPQWLIDAGMGQMNVEWTMYKEENISGYFLWGSKTDSRASAELINQIIIPISQTNVTGQNDDAHESGLASYSYQYIATVGQAGQPTDGEVGYNYYWLEAVGTDDTMTPVAFTSKRIPANVLYLPHVSR